MSHEDFEKYQKQEEEERLRKQREVFKNLEKDSDVEQVEVLKKELADLEIKIKAAEELLTDFDENEEEKKTLLKERNEIDTILKGLDAKIKQLDIEQKSKGGPENFTEEDWVLQCDLMIHIADLEILHSNLFDELLDFDSKLQRNRDESVQIMDEMDAIDNQPTGN